jgi:alkylhydroperoxidase family enzyme
MTILAQVDWGACLLEPRRDRALERYARSECGVVPEPLAYFAAVPWIARSLVEINSDQIRLVHLSFELADLVGLVVSQDASCRFCYATQRVMLRLMGFPEARIRELESDLGNARATLHEKTALEFARRIARASPPLCATDLAPLRAAKLEDAAIQELAVVAALHVYFNRLMTIPAIPPQRMERSASRDWMLRLAGPVFRRRLRRVRGRAVGLSAAEREGRYAYLVGALDGLPAAIALRKLLDAAWTSPVLAPRTKAFVFAVVARGLDSALAEREAAAVLREHGIEAERLDAILRHLGGPELDAVETAVLHFARDSIRSRPAQLQQRARWLREQLGETELVELVGVTALANAVCRLGVVTLLA